jgi:RimJ/RimL family protein N-acetyltransferase
MSSAPFPATWPGPESRTHAGSFVTLTPADAEADVEALYAAAHDSVAARDLWQYMPCGPFADPAGMRAWVAEWQGRPDVVAFTVRSRETGRPVGMISLMRITPEHGVAELGFIWYAPAVQRTKVNTECVYLLLRHLFDDLHYRRAEWKCDDQNARSKAAALRLGFQFEGLFRQHLVVKGHNRDTAWFAMMDGEWPERKAALERWLYSGEGLSLASLNRTLTD